MEVYVRNYIKECEAYGWEGGPEYNTEIVPIQNKAEKRNARWSQSRFFASLPFMNLRVSRYVNILDMFHDRKGQWGAFLYRNPLGYQAEDMPFGVGNGTQTVFQLAYTTIMAGRETTRNVYALYIPEDDSNGEAVESNVVVYVNGVATPVTVDHDRGLVTFGAAPANDAALTWDGEFSHWVRFAGDRLPFSVDNISGDELVTNGSVELIEVNPPEEMPS
jgi:uncharacterized protein (TIGR02217 family)